MLISAVASEIERLAEGTEIGNLQALRTRIKRLQRMPGHSIFHSLTISDNEEWAFHYGGRRELQFNIGFENDDLRYGVAFSLKPSRTLPDISELVPSIRKFNQFISERPEYFRDCIMWHWYFHQRSQDYVPRQINNELIKDGLFIFIGKKQPRDQINYQEIIRFWKYLLELYKYVENRLSNEPSEIANDGNIVNPSLEFRSGHVPVTPITTAETISRIIDVNIRHALIQTKLYNELLQVYDENCVGTEVRIMGKKIDLVVRHNEENIFYEIKTASTAKSCAREAMGQLLEYCFYRCNGNGFASKLVIVGECDSDTATNQYLSLLSERIGISIEYKQIVLADS